jgi:hypothetical protein
VCIGVLNIGPCGLMPSQEGTDLYINDKGDSDECIGGTLHWLFWANAITGGH